VEYATGSPEGLQAGSSTKASHRLPKTERLILEASKVGTESDMLAEVVRQNKQKADLLIKSHQDRGVSDVEGYIVVDSKGKPVAPAYWQKKWMNDILTGMYSRSQGLDSRIATGTPWEGDAKDRLVLAVEYMMRRQRQRTADFQHGGQRVLFIEEFQSDWHQAGKARGYIGETPTELKAEDIILGEESMEDYVANDKSRPGIAVEDHPLYKRRVRARLYPVTDIEDETHSELLDALPKYSLAEPDGPVLTYGVMRGREYVHLGHKLLMAMPERDRSLDYRKMLLSKALDKIDLVQSAPGYDSSMPWPNDPGDPRTALEFEILERRRGARGFGVGRRAQPVPDAPFKKYGWVDLLMKRMVSLAVEEGFDVVSWTTPAQQHARGSARTLYETIYAQVMKDSANNIAKTFKSPGVREIDLMGEEEPPNLALLISPDIKEGVEDSGLSLFQGDIADPKASVEFMEDGRALIRGFQNSDVSSGIHELAHVARRRLFDPNVLPEHRLGISDKDIQVAEKWAGVKDGKWTRTSEEKFAKGLEKYLFTGDAPTPELQGLFDRIANFLKRIYVSLTGPSISPEMAEVFGHMMQRGALIDKVGKPALGQITADVVRMFEEGEGEEEAISQLRNNPTFIEDIHYRYSLRQDLLDIAPDALDPVPRYPKRSEKISEAVWGQTNYDFKAKWGKERIPILLFKGYEPPPLLPGQTREERIASEDPYANALSKGFGLKHITARHQKEIEKFTEFTNTRQLVRAFVDKIHSTPKSKWIENDMIVQSARGAQIAVLW
ncbi:MAG: hypothetical protein NZ842_09690, partial [Dehalococcoidia bacterium]|nr:hypothetical protein [Dehalococcoidia bacterium]